MKTLNKNKTNEESKKTNYRKKQIIEKKFLFAAFSLLFFLILNCIKTEAQNIMGMEQISQTIPNIDDYKNKAEVFEIQPFGGILWTENYNQIVSKIKELNITSCYGDLTFSGFSGVSGSCRYKGKFDESDFRSFITELSRYHYYGYETNRENALVNRYNNLKTSAENHARKVIRHLQYENKKKEAELLIKLINKGTNQSEQSIYKQYNNEVVEAVKIFYGKKFREKKLGKEKYINEKGKEKYCDYVKYTLYIKPVIISKIPFSLTIEFVNNPGLAFDKPENVIDIFDNYTFPLVLKKVTLTSNSLSIKRNWKDVYAILRKKFKDKLLETNHFTKENPATEDDRGWWAIDNKGNELILRASLDFNKLSITYKRREDYLEYLTELYEDNLSKQAEKEFTEKKDMGSKL